MGSRGISGGPKGSGCPFRSYEVKRDVRGIIWGHPVGLMRLLMIHICLYTSDPDFTCGRVHRGEIVQEVLADLESEITHLY